MALKKPRSAAEKDFEVATIRGLLIHHMIWLEHITEDIIASHYCDGTHVRKEFIHVVLNREQVTLKLKLEVLHFILANHYPEVIDENPTFYKDYEDMIVVRNNMAHKKFFGIQSFQENDTWYMEGFSTKRNKIKTKQIIISHKISFEYIAIIDRLFKILTKVRRELYKG